LANASLLTKVVPYARADLVCLDFAGIGFGFRLLIEGAWGALSLVSTVWFPKQRFRFRRSA
jgi:hypothetical protein